MFKITRDIHQSTIPTSFFVCAVSSVVAGLSAVSALVMLILRILMDAHIITGFLFPWSAILWPVGICILAVVGYLLGFIFFSRAAMR